MNREVLINQLKLERPKAVLRPVRRRWGLWLALASLAVGLSGAAVAWRFWSRPLAVETVVVRFNPQDEEGAGQRVLEASGYVVARRQATVASKVIGRVTEVRVEEGQTVEKGAVIALLDTQITRAQLDEAIARQEVAAASVRQAEVRLTDARPKLARSRSLHERGYLSEQAVEDAQAAYDDAAQTVEVEGRRVHAAQAEVGLAQRNLEEGVVRAPFAGVITVKAAQPGEIVSPTSAGGFTRTGICTIVDMASLEVQVEVGEKLIDRVTTGMPVTVKLNAYPNWAIPAEVIAVIPTADRSKATVSVRVGFKVNDRRIIPEMGAQVSFLRPADPTPALGPRIILPPLAIREGRTGASVLILDGDRVRQRPVVLGARSPAGQGVVSGLSPGERVVARPPDALKDGDRVRAAAREDTT
jgi:RND family efflux transporter MFP subunit